MATAISKVVKRVEVNEIVLTLSEDEAKTLQAIFSRIGGNCDHSPRRHTDALAGALRTIVGSGTQCADELEAIGNGINEARGGAIYFRAQGE